jgi:hypothetical protein
MFSNGTALLRPLRESYRAALGCPSIATGRGSRLFAKKYRDHGTQPSP